MAVEPSQLMRFSLFSQFGEAGVGRLASICEKQKYSSGRSLFNRGDDGRELFLVHTGRVDIWARVGGKERKLCEVSAGESLGEMALIRPGKRIISAKTAAQSELILMPRAAFSKLLKEKPQTGLKLMMALFRTVEARLSAVSEPLMLLF